MGLTKALLWISVAAFTLTGLGYLLAPVTMLSVVGVASEPTTEFLIRTEGVALLFGAACVWTVLDGSARATRIVLTALAFYYIVGSVIDLQAFSTGVVGQAAVPSAIIRIVTGGLCLVSAVRMGASEGT